MIKTIPHVIPRAMGVMFLWAGLYKVVFLGQAIASLEALEVPRLLADRLVLLATSAEIYLGFLLFFKIAPRFAMRLAISVLFLFSTYVFYLSTLADPPSCGCLGLTGIFKNSRHQSFFDLTRNVLLLWAMTLSYSAMFHSESPLNNSGNTQLLSAPPAL